MYRQNSIQQGRVICPMKVQKECLVDLTFHFKTIPLFRKINRPRSEIGVLCNKVKNKEKYRVMPNGSNVMAEEAEKQNGKARDPLPSLADEASWKPVIWGPGPWRRITGKAFLKVTGKFFEVHEGVLTSPDNFLSKQCHKPDR